jgi:hypothetical protein
VGGICFTVCCNEDMLDEVDGYRFDSLWGWICLLVESELPLESEDKLSRVLETMVFGPSNL